MGDTRRRVSDCAATHRGWPDAAAVVLHFKPVPARPSRQSIFHLASHSAEPTPSAIADQTSLCRASSPLQKRAGRPARSLAVISSTTSTFQPRRLRLGKGVIASSSTAAMAGPRRSWRSTRPAVLAPFHPLLCLALGHRNPTEARRVTSSGCVAVSSPEPAVPWLCAAVLVATPSSHVLSCNRWFP